MNKFFNKLYNILTYLDKCKKSNSNKYFEIISENSNELLCKINKSYQIKLLSKTVTMLFEDSKLHSPEFENQILNCDDVIIEINYPSNIFQPIYNIITSIKNKSVNTIHISVYYNDKETDNNFQNNNILNSITFGPLVLSIKGSFHNCTSLKEVIISSSLSTIGDNAFSNCTSLSKISIPNSVIYIGKSAFYNCSQLTEMIIPCSLTEINEQAFANCFYLKKVIIPTSVSSIGPKSFMNCKSLKEIDISSSVNNIGNEAFSGCQSLMKINLPSSITKISSLIFNDCSSLTKITIPSSVTIIQSQAF